ncbi:MAG: hypothetical protein U1E36_01880 [Rickettsiales bacterium]
MKQAYNMVWLSPKFVSSDNQNTTSFFEPIPTHPLQSMMDAAQRNPSADVFLWIDSKRMTREQMEWLQATVVSCPSGNFFLRDLRDIPRYCEEKLFNQPDDNLNWRQQKQSLIWAQVDTARVLVVEECLRAGGYDNAAYADADVIDFDFQRPKIKKALEQYGVIIARQQKSSWVEHHMFAFNKSRLPELNALLDSTLDWVYRKHQNGYRPFQDFIEPFLAGITDNNPDACMLSCKFNPKAKAIEAGPGPTKQVTPDDSMLDRVQKRQPGDIGLPDF